MSASASKKKRRQLEQEGISLGSATKAKATEQKKKTTRTVIIFAAVILAAIAAVLLLIHFLHAPHYNVKTPIATVGEEKVTVPVYNHFYTFTVNEQVQSNYMLSYLLQANPGKKYSEIKYSSDGRTLKDMFVEATNAKVQEYYNIYAEAKKHGYKLTEDDNKQIEAAVSQLKTEATNSGYSKLNRYMAARFGEGCTEATYREFLTVYYTFIGYRNQLTKEFNPSDDEIANSYAEDPSKYDVVNFTYATIDLGSKDDEKTDDPAATDPTEPEATEPEATEPEATEPEATEPETTEPEATEPETTEPEATEPETKPDEGKEELPETDKDGMPASASTVTWSKATVSSYLNAPEETLKEIADWLFDTARKEGDLKEFTTNEDGTKKMMIRFNYRDDYDYSAVNAFVIKISKTASTEEGAKTPKEQLLEITSQLTPEMTDEEFGKIASTNGGSSTASILDKNAYPKEVNDYLFDPSRKAGDTNSVIETDTDYYILRYVSTEENTCRHNVVKNTLLNEMYQKLASTNKIQINEKMVKYANTDLTTPSAS